MKKIFLIVLALGLNFVASFGFAGVTWEPDVRLTKNQAGSLTRSSWSVATDSQNRVHVVWCDSRDGNSEIYYKRSLNGGQTWGNDVRLTVNSTNSYDPSIATDSQNRVHVVWYDNRDGHYEIYYKRSLDGGQTWGNDTRLTVNVNGYPSWSPSIATDSQSRVHVVWCDSRDGNSTLYYKRSLDGGQSWGNDIRLTKGIDSFEPSIATDSQNRVHVVWRDDRYVPFLIYYNRSLDGGQTWGNDIRLAGNGAGSHSPSVATDSQNRVHVVWHDYRDGNPEIYYKRSVDGGGSWGNDVRLTVNIASSASSSIATDSKNRVHVVWDDGRNDNYEIYYKRSMNGGQTWENDARVTVNSAISKEPSIATDVQNRLHVVWTDERDGYGGEIYYKRGIQVAKWTVMVYGAADNNLDLNGVEDLNELEYAGSGNDVNMIYLLDKYGMNDTKLYYVQNDPNGKPDGSDPNIISQDISESARSWLAQEEDMSNPQTLEDFALWTMANYPADNYLISIWDHGDGIFVGDQNRCSGGLSEGMVWDANGGVPGEYIDLAEFKDVLAALYAANGNKKLNIVGLDACLMGQVETFYQMKDYVDFGIASENYEPGDGWEYGYPFKELVINPDMPARDLASRIVDFYGQRYTIGNDPDPSATIAAVDLGSFPNTLVPAVNNFAGYLYSFMNPFETAIQTARSSADVYNPDGENPDLYHFSQLISQDTNLPLSLRNSANQVMASYPGFIVKEWHGSQSPNAHGLSIWFPENYTQNSHYPDYLTKIDFSQEKWDEFLGIYETPFEVLSLKLTLNTPIVHRGENLKYTTEIGNLSWVSHNLKTWADLTLPNGSPYPGNPVVGPMNLTLGPGQTLQRNLSYGIPLRTPLGTYTTTGNLSTIDDLLLDQDSFNFQVAPSQGLRFGSGREKTE